MSVNKLYNSQKIAKLVLFAMLCTYILKSTYQVTSRAIRPHGEGFPRSRLSVGQDGRTGTADEALHRGLGGHGVDARLRCFLVENRVKAVGLAITGQVELQR